jgi:hypothetical protein
VKDYVNKNSRQHYLIFPANNLSITDTSYSKNWAYPYLENNGLTNTSTPAAVLWNENTDGSKLMNKPLTNMSVTNGLASFTLTAGPSAIDDVSAAKGSYELIYRQGALSIVRLPNGEVRKVMMK